MAACVRLACITRCVCVCFAYSSANELGTDRGGDECLCFSLRSRTRRVLSVEEMQTERERERPTASVSGELA